MKNGMTNAKRKINDIHCYFGCHTECVSGAYECTYRLYAPKAKQVYLTGDHNGWTSRDPMYAIGDGVWECVLPFDTTPHGLKYKYLVRNNDSEMFLADPFARAFECGGEFASVITIDEPYMWEDRLWLRNRAQSVGGDDEFFAHPLNIYEIHLATWRTRHDGSALSYRELADELSSYVKQLGCTHIAIISDDTATARGCFSTDPMHGTPSDFKYFVNRLHSVGIGVISDLPALYNNALPDMGRYTRDIVISCAEFLINEYHIDGIKVTASAKVAEDVINEIAVTVRRGHPDVLLISETEGCGYDLVYHKEWTRQTLEYIAVDPFFRKGEHDKLISPIKNAFSAKGILSFSHKDVSEKNLSLLDKSYGSYDMKFAGTRLLRAYQMTYPGKKLTFMGCEYGPFQKWSENIPLEWFMLDFERHRQLLDFTAELGNFYLSEPCLWERDFSHDGFEWIYPDMAELNVVAYRRLSANGSETVVLLNFAPVDREGFTVINMKHKKYKEIFSSDAARFGGTNKLNPGVLYTVPVHDGTRSLKLTLPGLSAVILKPI